MKIARTVILATVGACVGLLGAASLAGCGEEEEKGPTPTATPTAAIVATPEGTPSPETTPVPTATAAPVVTATPAGQAGRIIFLRDDELWAIDPDESNLALLAEDIRHGESSPLGFPARVDSAPRLSPRGDKVAFIGSDGNLWVVDAEGGNPLRLSAEALPPDDTFCERKVFVAGWAPDGERILYYVDSYDPMGGVCTPRPDGVLGFHVVDVELGTETPLPGLPNFLAWLDTQRVIFFQETPPPRWSTQWHTFDISTEETQELTKVPFECFSLQESLSYADNTLVYSCANTDEGSKIVHANIDNTGQRVLLEGEWTDLQHPRVSPSGKAFIFERQRDIGGGLYEQDLYRYDLASDEETLVMSGFLPLHEWLDERRIVVFQSTGSLFGPPTTLYVVDTITGDKTTLAENVEIPW